MSKHRVSGQDHAEFMQRRAAELVKQIRDGTFVPVKNTPEEQAKVDRYLAEIKDSFGGGGT